MSHFLSSKRDLGCECYEAGAQHGDAEEGRRLAETAPDVRAVGIGAMRFVGGVFVFMMMNCNHRCSRYFLSPVLCLLLIREIKEDDESTVVNSFKINSPY
jgi:hypothetical protein